MSIAAPTDQEPYRSPLMVPQFKAELVLRARLAEFGAAPRYGFELTAMELGVDHVLATIRSAAGEEIVKCKYMIGADGGRSVIRQSLGVDFPGNTLGVRAVVP